MLVLKKRNQLRLQLASSQDMTWQSLPLRPTRNSTLANILEEYRRVVTRSYSALNRDLRTSDSPILMLWFLGLTEPWRPSGRETPTRCQRLDPRIGWSRQSHSRNRQNGAEGGTSWAPCSMKEDYMDVSMVSLYQRWSSTYLRWCRK